MAEPLRDDILAWLREPRHDVGLWFLEDEHWVLHSYAELAERARRAGGLLRDGGVRPGDRVMVLCPNSPEFAAMFYGALLAGATPAPAGMPAALQSRDAYLANAARLVQLVQPTAIASTPEVVAALGGAGSIHDVPIVVDDGSRTPEPLPPLAPPELGILQFSSGSTALPKGIKIGLDAVNANAASIRTWLGWRTTDAMASWLPFSHDMGLIGLLAAMAQSGRIYVLRPDQFIRYPLKWLSLIAERGATTTASPTFGLAHVVRKVRPAQVAGLDLSGWRHLIVGAERVDADVLRAFADLLAPCGFDRRTILPSYGLAEVTVAAAALPPATGWTSALVDPASLAMHERIRPTDPAGPAGAELVGCGEPLPGMTVRVVDDEGAELPDDVLGEIEVGGPSLASGYFGDDDAGFADGVFRTGDAGFSRDGQVFVVGRLGDAIKRLGRWIFAEDVERVAVEASPRPSRTTALLGMLDGRETAVVIVEAIGDEQAAELGAIVAKHYQDLRVAVYRGEQGWVQRTTSGKPMRRKMWRRLISDEPAAAKAWDSNSDTPPA